MERDICKVLFALLKSHLASIDAAEGNKLLNEIFISLAKLAKAYSLEPPAV
jgi:hypothetical protein